MERLDILIILIIDISVDNMYYNQHGRCRTRPRHRAFSSAVPRPVQPASRQGGLRREGGVHSPLLSPKHPILGSHGSRRRRGGAPGSPGQGPRGHRFTPIYPDPRGQGASASTMSPSTSRPAPPSGGNSVFAPRAAMLRSRRRSYSRAVAWMKEWRSAASTPRWPVSTSCRR